MPYSEWLEKFKVDILRGYNDGKMVENLSAFSYESPEPRVSLPHEEEPSEAQILLPGQIIPEQTFHYRHVTPVQVGKSYDISSIWGHIDQVDFSFFMYKIGLAIALDEYKAIAKSISSFAGHKHDIEDSEFDIDHVNSAIKEIHVGNMYPTGILVNKDKIKTLKLNKDFFDWWKVDEKWVPKNERTTHFQGMLKGLAVYDAPFFSKKMLQFDKHHIHIVCTPIDVRFIRERKRPTVLVVERDVSSAPIVDNAVVEITLLD